MNRDSIDWAHFLGRPPMAPDPALAESVAADKSVLITGAAGSIGSGLAQAILTGGPRTLVLLDLSEGGLYEAVRGLPPSSKTRVVPIVGGIADSRLLTHLLRSHRPDLILHAAAYKHVSLMERNPFSAIANNAIGTYTLVTCARDFGVDRLLMVSTDKAVHPRGIMGASKRIAELVILAHATDNFRINAVRLGNVLGSSGSVAPLFAEQARQSLPLTVTHKEATRFFLTPVEAETAILQAAGASVSGKILVPDCGRPLPIVDLARYVAPDRPIGFIGLRPGDKLSEELMSETERTESVSANGMRLLVSPCPTASEISASMNRIAAAVDNFTLDSLLEAVIELVPDYLPSTALLGGNSE